MTTTCLDFKDPKLRKNFDRCTTDFNFRVDGDLFIARVSREAIDDYNAWRESSSDEHLDFVKEHFSSFQNIVSKKFFKDPPTNGSMLITLVDSRKHLN